MHESKEKIRSRMIKSASYFWGYNDLQPEDSFDPLVGLLLGACAAELEKINREISETESRLIEKLIDILTPGPITSPMPAHGVLHIHPQKPELIIDQSYPFFYTKKTGDIQSGKSEEKQIHFSPAGNFLLLDADIRYIALNNSIFEFSESEFKEQLFESEKPGKLPSNRIYIGLEWNLDLKNLGQIPVYINARSSYFREMLLNLLPRTIWYFNGQRLESHPGYPKMPGFIESPLQKLENEFDVISKILNYTRRYYEDNFITIDFKGIGIDPEEAYKIPEALKKAFTLKQTEKLEEDIIWLEVFTPDFVEEGMAEDLYVFLNAVPVINCRLNEFTGITRENINIVPIFTEEYFLDLKSVIGKNGEPYQRELFSGMNQIKSGSLLLRQGNIGRFDSVQAKEYLEYLLEMLKDESAAFNVIGSDLLHANLKELNQAIARFEKKITETEISRSGNQYLILQPYKGDDLVFIQFWSTNGPQANGIKSGAHFHQYTEKDIQSNSLKLLTSTSGGKDRPGREERINVYRSALLSKNRIVTEEDIKTLCYLHIGDEITGITVKKGISEGNSPLQGFIRTIDVIIELNEHNKFDEESLFELKKGLLVKLEQRSAMVFPYRVFFE